MRLPQSTLRIPLFLTFGCLILITGLQGSARATNQLTFNPASLRFGEVVVGRTASLTATMTNSGTTSVTVSTMNVTSAVYKVSHLTLPLTLAAGQSTTFTVAFAPTVSGLANGSIQFNGNASSLNLRGSGEGSQSLTANPPSVPFGNVQTGSTGTVLVTLTNSESSSVTISRQSTSAGFSTSGLSLPLTLAAGHRITFSMTFSPTTVGSVAGTFEGLSSGKNVLIGIPLTGTGTAPGQLTVSPASVNFGNVNVGSSSSQGGTLSATGASVTVSSATSNSSEFTFSGLTFPVTIAAGQSVAYTATFTPQTSGSASAKLSFSSNASDPTASEALNGTGVAAQQYSVSLSWDASTSQVSGYNVYRGITAGGPYSKINTVLDASTTYVDGTVAGGQTYYYVTTAVNSSGQESSYSNQVEAVIP